MDYEFCYDIAEYLNEVNRGKHTAREIAIAAYEYKLEWIDSLRNHEMSSGLRGLIETLKENANEGDDKARDYLEVIIDKANGWKIKERR